VDDKEVISEFVGTVCYLAPERFRRYKGYEARMSDMWALGVTCYEMLTGKRCFYGNSDHEVARKIAKNKWHWPRSFSTKHFSPQCKHFVKSLLTLSVTKRPSARDALMHPWFNLL